MGKTSSRYVIIGIITTLLIATIAISYAYWRGSIIGEGEEITVTLNQLKIIFTDTQRIAEENINIGWKTSKTFTVENEGTTPYEFDIYIEDWISTLEVEGFLQYKITSDNGYNMTSYKALPLSSEKMDTTLVYGATINGLEKTEYTIEFWYEDSPDVDQSGDMGKSFNGRLMIRENKVKPLYDKILADHPTVNTRISGTFDVSIWTTTIGTNYDTTGVIYKESVYKESGKDVYYFAGNPQDNWVKFAGFYWRIIRTNEDGSVRLLYAGTSPDTTEGYITSTRNDGTISTTTWYGPGDSSSTENYNNTRYVGWMYGDAGSIGSNRDNTTDSGAKTFLDNWYKDVIASNKAYSNLVSRDAIYCNDRASGEYAVTGYMSYAARDRLNHQGTAGRQPSYQCGQNTAGGYTNTSDTWVNSTTAYTSSKADTADKFSVTTGSGGNGQLKYPVGLMTADEVAFAGGLYANNAPNTYYYRNSVTSGCTGSSGDPCSVTGMIVWWTMSPFYASSSSWAYVFSVFGSNYPGRLNYDWVSISSAVRPVISLKPEVVVTSGNGTSSEPYEVSL